MSEKIATKAHNRLEKVQTGELASEFSRRTARVLLRKMESVLSPHDSLSFTLGALCGVIVDVLLFPNGLATPVVSLLSGTGLMVVWKLWNNSSWRRKRALGMIKTLADENLISQEEATRWRKVVLEQYISMDGINNKPT